MLELKNITKDYLTASETVSALKGVSIAFRDREFVSILGPSGCGKTTLLNIIGGLDRYTSGDLIINGRSTRSYRDKDWDVYRNHRIGFIFQSYNLIPHQTVLGNVELALTIAGIGKEERTSRAKAALDKVGLSGQYNKRPNQLSGGQCQRVAIARALVNDPEILLADEPTGALDTVTSVQIMDLIREISRERLVIMVTHNPELAMKYSTRIIRLLDGRVIQDTRPVSAAELVVSGGKKSRRQQKAERRAERKKGKEKAKMSFFTAFRLSAKNLISKKGRTSMVGLAGSIGIIGIALVLAFSSGIKGYVASMQDDLLSGNPIEISETTYDLEALTGMMSSSEKEEIIKEPNKVFINSLVKYIATMDRNVDSMIIKNDISKTYVDYIKAMPESYYSAMLFGYGINLNDSIYTSFSASNGETKDVSISALTNIYTSILKETEFAQYASYVTAIAPSFQQAPNSKEYISHQYEVFGEIADEADEVMLVLDSNDRLSDLLLARLGFFTQDEFIELVKSATEEDGEITVTKDHFTYDELLGKTFTWYENDAIYTRTEGTPMNPFTYNHTAENNDGESLELRVVGILRSNETTTYGCLRSGIYYTEDFTNHVLSTNADSEIVKYVNEKGDITSMSYAGMNVGIYYNYTYHYEGEEKSAVAFVGQSLGIEDIMGAMGGMGSTGGTGGAGGAGGAGGVTGGTTGGMGGSTGGNSGNTGGGMINMGTSTMRTVSARSLGGVDIANNILIYPVSFDDKDLVTAYLDSWNGDGAIAVGNESISSADRVDITYTDTLELVINLINNMIDVVSAALIAFTSISLVVSTVMIGIITYVSVVERIKEIGVIRSLGGRKKDVSRLFTAETFIIGLLAGLFGITATYGISAIASLIVKELIGIPNIASLEVTHAIILVLLSITLTLISGVLPARSAAKKDPVVALRTE